MTEGVVIEVRPSVISRAPFFHIEGRQYFEAGEAIRVDGGISRLQYFLICRSIELSLKSFLITRDIQWDFKGKDGHSLKKHLYDAKAFGLYDHVHLTGEQEKVITDADKYYASKGFEYMDGSMIFKACTGYKGLPPIDPLIEIARRLTTDLKPIAYATPTNISEDVKVGGIMTFVGEKPKHIPVMPTKTESG